MSTITPSVLARVPCVALEYCTATDVGVLRSQTVTAVFNRTTPPAVHAVTTVLVMVHDTGVRDTVCRALRHDGYEVLLAPDSTAGLHLAASRQCDLVLLDTRLTPLDGLTCCRLLRRTSDVPILLLIGHHDVMAGVAGLELGADDYLAQPFRLVELLARIHALLRRRPGRSPVLPREVLADGDLRVDVGARRVFCGADEVLLAPKDFDLLVFLMRHRGATLSRELLRQQVWGLDHPIAARTVDVHIRWLREEIEADPAQPVYIHTVRGSGYRFEARGGPSTVPHAVPAAQDGRSNEP
jgi:DNA-binding response OmpR family regulator